MGNFIVSARKYRPQTFDTVVGQQSITNTLKNAIVNNHLAQAFLAQAFGHRFCAVPGFRRTHRPLSHGDLRSADHCATPRTTCISTLLAFQTAWEARRSQEARSSRSTLPPRCRRRSRPPRRRVQEPLGAPREPKGPLQNLEDQSNSPPSYQAHRL